MGRSVVIIGNFDGVHRGHQSLLSRARSIADAEGDDRPLSVIAVTFWPHPVSVVAPDKMPPLLSDLDARIAALKYYGADEVHVVSFDQDMASWSPERFIESVLLPLEPEVVIVGQNFTFGHRASGNAGTLARYGEGRFRVEAAVLTTVEKMPTSSTAIREAIFSGEVEKAARLLGRLYAVSGVVVQGDQRGRLLGFPTANLIADEKIAIPADGVYAGYLSCGQGDMAHMPAAISVGTNPTFDGIQRRIETYVLDRNDLELYGVEIQVDFVQRLRGQVRFANLDALVQQMNEDVMRIRSLLEDDDMETVRFL